MYDMARYLHKKGDPDMFPRIKIEAYTGDPVALKTLEEK